MRNAIAGLTPAERRRVLEDWNDTARVIPQVTLPELFEAQVARTPDAPAVIFEGTRVSYAELNARANRLARLLTDRGVGPESIVALALPRTADLVVAVLAVAKTGGAYLPVDPGYPAQRIGYMLTDAAPVCVITAGEVAGMLPAAPPVLVLDDPAVAGACAAQSSADLADADRVAALLPAHPAYVIYTSGSTGQPKGVVVSHGNATALFDSVRERFGFTADDVWSLFHSIAFDFSVWELWGPLLHGAALRLVSFEVSRSAGDFLDLLVRERVTILSQTPAALDLLMSEMAERGVGVADLALRLVVLGGEALDPASLRDRQHVWHHRDDRARDGHAARSRPCRRR
jgi:non-ribosomal peptide synthetase component F